MPRPLRAPFWIGCLVLALAVPPGDAAAGEFERGLEALSAGDLAAAEAAFGAASSDDVEALYYLGLTHQRQGRHEDAAAVFEDAIDRDPTLVDAWAPLGVSRYRLGDGAGAEAALREALAQFPDDTLAHLFLGLVRQEAGRCAEAVPHLERAAADPGVADSSAVPLALCYRQAGRANDADAVLARVIEATPDAALAADARALRSRDASTAEDDTSRRWSITGSAGISYDDNVVQDELDVDSGSGDFAGLFEFSPSVALLRSETTELEVGYDLYQSLYFEEDQFDLQSHSLFGDAHHTLGGADLAFSYRWSHATLGGDDFLGSHSIRPSVGYALRPEWYAQLGYRFAARDFESAGRDSRAHGVSLDQYYFLADGKGHLRLAYRHELEDADAPELDHRAHHLSVGARLEPARFALPRALFDRLEVGVAYTFALYDYDHTTPSIGARREDTRHGLEFSLARQLREALTLHLEYEFTDAQSNLPSAEYAQNVVTLRLGAEF